MSSNVIESMKQFEVALLHDESGKVIAPLKKQYHGISALITPRSIHQIVDIDSQKLVSGFRAIKQQQQQHQSIKNKQEQASQFNQQSYKRLPSQPSQPLVSTKNLKEFMETDLINEMEEEMEKGLERDLDRARGKKGTSQAGQSQKKKKKIRIKNDIQSLIDSFQKSSRGCAQQQQQAMMLMNTSASDSKRNNNQNVIANQSSRMPSQRFIPQPSRAMETTATITGNILANTAAVGHFPSSLMKISSLRAPVTSTSLIPLVVSQYNIMPNEGLHVLQIPDASQQQQPSLSLTDQSQSGVSSSSNNNNNKPLKSDFVITDNSKPSSTSLNVHSNNSQNNNNNNTYNLDVTSSKSFGLIGLESNINNITNQYQSHPISEIKIMPATLQEEDEDLEESQQINTSLDRSQLPMMMITSNKKSTFHNYKRKDDALQLLANSTSIEISYSNNAGRSPLKAGFIKEENEDGVDSPDNRATDNFFGQKFNQDVSLELNTLSSHNVKPQPNNNIQSDSKNEDDLEDANYQFSDSESLNSRLDDLTKNWKANQPSLVLADKGLSSSKSPRVSVKIIPVSGGNLSMKNELSANLIPSELQLEEESNSISNQHHNNSMKHPNPGDNKVGQKQRIVQSARKGNEIPSQYSPTQEPNLSHNESTHGSPQLNRQLSNQSRPGSAAAKTGEIAAQRIPSYRRILSKKVTNAQSQYSFEVNRMRYQQNLNNIVGQVQQIYDELIDDVVIYAKVSHLSENLEINKEKIGQVQQAWRNDPRYIQTRDRLSQESKRRQQAEAYQNHPYFEFMGSHPHPAHQSHKEKTTQQIISERFSHYLSQKNHEENNHGEGDKQPKITITTTRSAGNSAEKSREQQTSRIERAQSILDKVNAMKKEIFKEQNGEGDIECSKRSSDDRIVSSTSVSSSYAAVISKPNQMLSTGNIQIAYKDNSRPQTERVIPFKRHSFKVKKQQLYEYEQENNQNNSNSNNNSTFSQQRSKQHDRSQDRQDQSMNISSRVSTGNSKLGQQSPSNKSQQHVIQSLKEKQKQLKLGSSNSSKVALKQSRYISPKRADSNDTLNNSMQENNLVRRVLSAKRSYSHYEEEVGNNNNNNNNPNTNKLMRNVSLRQSSYSVHAGSNNARPSSAFQAGVKDVAVKNSSLFKRPSQTRIITPKHGLEASAFQNSSLKQINTQERQATTTTEHSRQATGLGQGQLQQQQQQQFPEQVQLQQQQQQQQEIDTSPSAKKTAEYYFLKLEEEKVRMVKEQVRMKNDPVARDKFFWLEKVRKKFVSRQKLDLEKLYRSENQWETIITDAEQMASKVNRFTQNAKRKVEQMKIVHSDTEPHLQVLYTLAQPRTGIRFHDEQGHTLQTKIPK